MKKLIAVLLTLVMVFSLAAVALANPNRPQGNPNNTNDNMNQNPGRAELVINADVRITVTGGGNNLTIRAFIDGVEEIVPRQGNGTFSQTSELSNGYVVFIRVQGNSLREATIISTPAPYVPSIVDEYEFYRFVRLNRVESRLVGTTEVSREFVNGAATVYNWERRNDFPGVNGQGVRTGATVTGTLNYTFNRNFVKQFERVYEWVDVTVWSDGERDEVVREDSEHVRGGLVDGDAYSTGPHDGSRAISVSGGQIILHMGFQGGLHDRTADVTVGAFTVNFELLNTGNSPSNTVVRITYVDLAAL